MTKATVFRKKVLIIAQRPVLIILRQIKNGLYRNLVEEVRFQRAAGNRQRADYFRGLIPEFTPSASFSRTRMMEFMGTYTHLVQLEVKNAASQELSNIKFTVSKMPYTFACFVNAEGDGLTILVRTMLDVEQHRDSFLAIRKYYFTKLRLLIGRQGQSIVDLCRYSYDPDIYLNMEASAFINPLRQSA